MPVVIGNKERTDHSEQAEVLEVRRNTPVEVDAMQNNVPPCIEAMPPEKEVILSARNKVGLLLSGKIGMVSGQFSISLRL